MPLSKGFVEGCNLRCGYHGLLFDGDGACVESPHSGNPPMKVSARPYPVVERWRHVWIWIGDPAAADPALIPDIHWCDDPDWAFEGGVYHIHCDHRLMVDNLMDLTHETYVHSGSIGQRELFEVPVTTTTKGDTVRVERWMRGVMPPPFWKTALKKEGPVDRWQICNFTLPANVVIDVGVALAGTGAPEGDRSQGVTGHVIDIMTPETERSCWYFWGMARSFDIHDRGFGLRWREAQARVFKEDVAVLEAQQRSIERHPDRRLAKFSIDAGGVQARRVIERAIARSHGLKERKDTAAE
jgi:vanillate O-demethylase monooxygenase subunit